MTVGSAETILQLSLAAAERATIAAHEGNLFVNEVGLLNEAWVQSYVTDAITRHLLFGYSHNRTLPFVTCETNVAWLDEFSGGKSRGRLANRLTPRSKFDVIVWRKGDGFAGLIEIKDQPVMDAYFKYCDTEKLIGELKRWPKLSWGIFLFSVRATNDYGAEELQLHLAGKYESVRAVIEETARRYKCVFRTHPRDIKNCPSLMWCGVIIRRRN